MYTKLQKITMCAVLMGLMMIPVDLHAATPTPQPGNSLEQTRSQINQQTQKTQDALNQQKKAAQDAYDKQKQQTTEQTKKIDQQIADNNTVKKEVTSTIETLQKDIAQANDPSDPLTQHQTKLLEQKKAELQKLDDSNKKLTDQKTQLQSDLQKSESNIKTIQNKIDTLPKDAQAELQKKVEAGIAPDIYSFKSNLLPGERTADYRSYFVDSIIARAIRLLISLTAAGSVIVIIYGGYRILFFAGNSENLEAGKNSIQWAIIGLLISLFAYAIVSIVTSLANI